MTYNELVIYLLLLSTITMTHSQVINYQHDRCNNDVDKDLLLKVRELQLELSAYRKEAMESERRLTQLKEEFAEYKNESMNRQTALEDELKRQDTTIGFTAHLTSDFPYVYNPHQFAVKYDAVETNMGNGYSNRSGIFTAPVAGTYVFIWHATTWNTDNGYCDLSLWKNGLKLLFEAHANALGRTTNGRDSASNSAVLTLNKGDTVFIAECKDGYLYGRPLTSFSGFKI